MRAILSERGRTGNPYEWSWGKEKIFHFYVALVNELNYICLQYSDEIISDYELGVWEWEIGKELLSGDRGESALIIQLMNSLC